MSISEPSPYQPACDEHTAEEKIPLHRYSAKPFPGSSHSWAKAHLTGLGADANVLDIGPGSGVMAEHLLSKGVTLLDCVEIDAATRAAIAPLYRESVESLEELKCKQYDVILTLDVLEHMADPRGYLLKLSQCLKEGGVLLISVPNIVHWSIRLQVLCGRFDYTNRGILDKTHLHFFTRRHLRRMIESVPQFALRELTGSISPAEFVLPEILVDSLLFRLFSATRMQGVRVLPGLCAFQHLALVRKNGAESL